MSAMSQFQKDLAGFDYVNIGDGNSSHGAGFEKYSFRMALPKRLAKPGSALISKLEYSQTNVTYVNEPKFDGKVDQFQSISYSLAYRQALKNNWSLMAMFSPGVSSNFDSSLQWGDIQLSGMLRFTKSIKPNMKLSLGMMYSTTTGSPAPMPVFSMMWKPNKKWTVNLGFPRTDVQYQLSPKTVIGTEIFMAGDNVTLSEDLYRDAEKIDNIRIMNVGSGLKFSQKITKYIKLNLSSGYTFYREYEFLDGNDSVMEYDLDNNFYVKAGISIGL